MKSLRLNLLNPIAALLAAACWLGGINASAAEPLSLRVVSFNLRYASDKKPNSWPERRPVMKECIAQMAPDIMGTQEGVYYQLKDIAADAPDYDWIGLGREGGSRGEFMAVYYRKARFEPVEYDHFWLSDTPNVIASTSWGNTTRRMTTWVRFRERATGREFYFFNTHLDNAVRVAREKSAVMIRERVASVVTNGLPVVLVGDFNARPGNEKTYDTLLEGGFFADTWLTAKTKKNEGFNTFHNFKGETKGGIRIDWIMTRGDWECTEAEIFVFAKNGQSPSDHHPIATRLLMK